MSDQATTQRLFSTAEAAKYLGISRQTLYNRTHRRAKNPLPIRQVRIGGKPLYDVADLDAFIDELKSK